MNIGRSLTRQELIMAANGDITGLEKMFNKSLPIETIKSMYINRFIDPKNDDLIDNEMCDVVHSKSNGIENAFDPSVVKSS